MESRASILLLALLVVAATAHAQGPGTVLSEQKISETQGGFTGELDQNDLFGCGLASLGDLDGDGVGDLAVGAFFDNDGGPGRGAVWILFLHADGKVKSHQKISSTEGDFGGPLSDADSFGFSLATLGDLNGDGVVDLAVGATYDKDGGTNRGAVWILFLNANGKVKSEQKISDLQGGFTGVLQDNDLFGRSVASLGDLDGDGVIDMAVGAPMDDDGGPDRGAVWILFLNANGTVKSHKKISYNQGGFVGALDDGDRFGRSVASLGDLDADGLVELAVGAQFDDDGGTNRGAVWILSLKSDGTVHSPHVKISDTEGGFLGVLDNNDEFGHSTASLGDLDGDLVGDLAVGAIKDDDGTFDSGAVWLLFLKADGTVKSYQKISATQGGFTGPLTAADFFGWSVASLGDLDGDGESDLASGAVNDDDGGVSQGAVWILFLDGIAPAEAIPYGCGVNPAGSLTLISGLPSIGTTVTLGVDNPLGTQPVGSLPFLALAFQPDPAFPCGALMPGFGMGGPGASGELLIPFDPPFVFSGPPWTGAGNPVPFALPIPNDPALFGFSAYVQGLMVDSTSAFGVTFGLTEAIELLVGP